MAHRLRADSPTSPLSSPPNDKYMYVTLPNLLSVIYAPYRTSSNVQLTRRRRRLCGCLRGLLGCLWHHWSWERQFFAEKFANDFFDAAFLLLRGRGIAASVVRHHWFTAGSVLGEICFTEESLNAADVAAKLLARCKPLHNAPIDSFSVNNRPT